MQFMFFELFQLINVYKSVMSFLHLQMHPDSDPSNPGLHSQFVQLSEAYGVLSRKGPDEIMTSGWGTSTLQVRPSDPPAPPTAPGDR